MNRNIPNLVIDASAGCGKTELLALRLLALLFSGVRLESVVAMTFTRTAAAEIYERLLHMLDAALADEKEQNTLKQRLLAMADGDIGGERTEELRFPETCVERFQNLTRADLLALLRGLLDGMNRIHISTIDSFMNTIVGAYGIEFGMCGQASMIDEEQGENLRRRILGELLGSCGIEDEDGFLNACRDAAFGKERKRFFDGCCDLLDEAIRFAPLLGDTALWNIGGEIADTPEETRRSALAAWTEFFASPAGNQAVGDKGRTRAEQLNELLHHLAEAGAESLFSGDELDVMRRFFVEYARTDGLAVKPASFAWMEKLSLPAARGVKLLLLHGAKLLVRQSARRTAGIGAMLRQYLNVYDREVIGRGQMQFQDLPRLLLRGLRHGELTDLAYRMNTRYEHWLFDEFQDTSRDQYEVFTGILSDLDREHESLFLVGDVKQALYSWRSGDSRLMGEAASEYRLSEGHLKESYRYGEAIATSLNELFTSPGLDDCGLPEAALRRWRDVFPHHTAAKSTKSGEFTVRMMESPDRDDPDSDDANAQIAEAIGQKLLAMDVLNRRISCAILVRGKGDGLKLKNAIESNPEFAALTPALLWEGDESIAKDRLVAGLLALAVRLQHPGNTFAAEQVEMNAILRRLNLEERIPALTRELADGGFHAFFTAQLAALRRMAEAEGTLLDAEETLSSASVAALLEAARRFDAAADRDALRFAEFAATRTLGERATAGRIRIMTVHHSKGLGFDAVFVPLTSRSKSLSTPPLDGFVRLRAADGQTRGLLYAPKPEGMLFDDIRSGVEEQWSDSAFEALCLLYVAMTRAKRSVDVYLPAPPKKATACYLHTVVQNAVAGIVAADTLQPGIIYHRGEADWYRTFQAKPRVYAASPALPDWTAPRRLRRLTPSATGTGTEREAVFLLKRSGSGADFGSRLHQFFAGVGFLDRNEVPEIPIELTGHWARCRASSAAVQLLSAHSNRSELWREKAFEAISGGNWISGCFDRVELVRDESGAVVECFLIDYKSNAIPPGEVEATAKKYRPQLELYASVLRRMLKLPPEKVHAALLFTACGEVSPLAF